MSNIEEKDDIQPRARKVLPNVKLENTDHNAITKKVASAQKKLPQQPLVHLKNNPATKVARKKRVK